MDVLEPPFIKETMEMPLPLRFRLPQTSVYNDKKDSID